MTSIITQVLIGWIDIAVWTLGTIADDMWFGQILHLSIVRSRTRSMMQVTSLHLLTSSYTVFTATTMIIVIETMMMSGDAQILL